MNELSEQNEILVETVEELEREANERVALVESKLQRSGASLKVMTHGPRYIPSLLLTFLSWCIAFVLGLRMTVLKMCITCKHKCDQNVCKLWFV